MSLVLQEQVDVQEHIDTLNLTLICQGFSVNYYMDHGSDYFPEGWTGDLPGVTNTQAVLSRGGKQFTYSYGLEERSDLWNAVATVVRGAERVVRTPSLSEYAKLCDGIECEPLYVRDLQYWDGLQLLEVSHDERESICSLMKIAGCN